MSKIPNIVPITDLRQDAASVLRRVRDTREPVFITQRGRAAAVLLSTETYERAEHDRELLLLFICAQSTCRASGLRSDDSGVPRASLS
jgi:prevent-host-death family protein